MPSMTENVASLRSVKVATPPCACLLYTSVQGESFFRRLLKKPGVQSCLAALLCIVIGLVVGYIVLLAIEPSGASKAIGAVLKNFLARRSLSLIHISDVPCRVGIIPFIIIFEQSPFVQPEILRNAVHSQCLKPKLTKQETV